MLPEGVAARWLASRETIVDVPPMIWSGVGRVYAEGLDGIDLPQDAFNFRPSADAQQDLAAGPDEGERLVRFGGRNRAHDVNARHHSAEVIRGPADELGGFLALAQWIVPYTLNTYRMSLTQAGLIASVFSFPAGVVRAAGGWLADRFGALTVMYYVFAASIVACLVLSIPRMEVRSPGEGVNAKAPGVVTSVSSNAIMVGERVLSAGTAGGRELNR
jgi:hypothetical protein